MFIAMYVYEHSVLTNLGIPFNRMLVRRNVVIISLTLVGIFLFMSQMVTLTSTSDFSNNNKTATTVFDVV